MVHAEADLQKFRSHLQDHAGPSAINHGRSDLQVCSCQHDSSSSVCSTLCSKGNVFMFFSVSFQDMQGAWRSFPSHANEAMGKDWKGDWTQFPVPANKMVGMGA